MRNWDTDIEYMKSLYIEGKSLEDIGAEYGISRERVRQLFVRYGFNYRRSPIEAANKWRTDKGQLKGYSIADLYKVYQQGASLSYIANELDVSVSVLCTRFKDNGYKTRPVGAYKTTHPKI